MGTLEDEVAAARAAGRRLGPFVLLDELGRGGMGVVHRAFDERRRAPVALKLLDPATTDREAAARLAREGRAVAALDHPAVVRLLDAGEVEGRPFVALELVEGASLGARLPPRGDLDLRGAVRVLRDVAGALAHAHERGVVHRDLKPSNVLVDPRGAGRLIDFGVARLGDQARLTATGALLGTPGFMAPEQANGEGARAGPAADVWGLGALLYLVLTGHPPFAAATVVATLRAIIEDEAPDPLARATSPDEPELAALTLACLAKEPGDRPSALAAGRTLSGWLERRHDPDARRRRRAAGRRPVAVAAAVLVVVPAAVVVAVVAVTRPRAAPPTTEPPPALPPEPPPRPIERAPPDVVGPLDERFRAAVAKDDLDAAWALLEEPLARWPDDWVLLCDRANLRWLRRDLAGARQDAERAVAVAPDEPGPRIALGHVTSAQGQPERAARTLDAAVALARAAGGPWPRQALLARARARRRAGQTQAALDDSAAVLASSPRDALAVAEQALALLEAGEEVEAWGWCEPLESAGELRNAAVAAAVARCAIGVGRAGLARVVLDEVRHGHSPGLLVARADLALAEGDLRAAEATLLRVLEVDPGDAMAWLLLASVKARAGAGPATLLAAEAAARVGHVPGAVWSGLGVELLRHGRPLEALAGLERGLVEVQDPELAEARAEVLLRIGDLRAAEAGAAALAKADPGRARTWAVLTMVRTRLGDLDGAEAALRSTVELVTRASEIDPVIQAAKAELALARPERLAEAEAAIEDLVADHDDHPEGHWLSARLLLARGDAAGAAGAASRALERPDVAPGGILCDPWSVRARARAALGDLDGALKDAEEALLQRPRAAEAFAARAEVHRRRGDEARAAADQTRARALEARR